MRNVVTGATGNIGTAVCRLPGTDAFDVHAVRAGGRGRGIVLLPRTVTGTGGDATGEARDGVGWCP